ncbi:MAG TPA: flavohemoglobin expression-modulating QEGLA motif protein, partial [Pseudohongiella sp.]|nr:flavohemoglobin expression-modulating QEGLA motif protein [Pseudohongiella sp.]
MTLSEYQAQVKRLSDQLIELQKPIRILDAIKWSSSLEKTFLAANGTEMPRLDPDHYQRIDLGFSPELLRDRFLELRREVRRKLGRRDGLGSILCDTVDQYLLVIELLRHRGTVDFGRYSRELYGSARDHLRGDRKSLRQLGEKLCDIFSLPAAEHLTRPYDKDIGAPEAVEILQQRLGSYFQPGDIRVILSDGIVSDAAAGGDYIKVNQDASFTDIDL